MFLLTSFMLLNLLTSTKTSKKRGNQAAKAIWKATHPSLTLPGIPCMNTPGSLERKRMGMLVERVISRKKMLPDTQERIKAARAPN